MSLKIECLGDILPYENYATFDTVRRLRWCNSAILYAIEYYRTVLDIQTDYDTILSELKHISMNAVMALTYGSLKAATPALTIQDFNIIYKRDCLIEYIDAVISGMKAYLPEPDGIVDTGENLDESYPDTQKDAKKKAVKTKPTGATGTGSRASK